MGTPEENNFNERVEKAPIIKEIQQELDGLKQGQEKMESRMETLEKKVDDGFNKIAQSIDDLKNEIKDEKLTKLEKQLERTQDNKDKVKNGSLITLIGAVGVAILENLGIINIVGQ